MIIPKKYKTMVVHEHENNPDTREVTTILKGKLTGRPLVNLDLSEKERSKR